MGDIFTFAKKFERAARNGTGFNVSADEMRTILDAGLLDVVQGVKVKELKAICPAKTHLTSSANTGSISDATEPVPTFGKSQLISREAAKSYIAALSAGA